MEETKSPKRRRTSLAILIQQDLEDAWKKEQRDGASEKSIAMLTLNSARGALERTLCPGLGLSPKDEDWNDQWLPSFEDEVRCCRSNPMKGGRKNQSRTLSIPVLASAAKRATQRLRAHCAARYMAAGESKLRCGDHEGASEDFESATVMAPLDAASHLALAKRRQCAGREADYELELRRAVGVASLPDADVSDGKRSNQDSTRKKNHLEAGLEALKLLALLLCQRPGGDAEAARAMCTLGLSFRLAPSVLRYARPPTSYPTHTNGASSGGIGEEARFVESTFLPPSAGVCVVDDALPERLFEQLREAFSPTSSPFWREHAYDDPATGYFSYVLPISKMENSVDANGGSIKRARGKRKKMQDDDDDDDAWADTIIGQFLAVLLKCAEQRWPGVSTACGAAEWWAHCRNHSSGHQLHFDSAFEGLTVGGAQNPLVSTVLYLSDEGVGGPTLVTSQRLLDQHMAKSGYLVRPKPNRLCLFEGDLLHGVLPGRGSMGPDQAALHRRRVSLMVALWPSMEGSRYVPEAPGPAQCMTPAIAMAGAREWPKRLYGPLGNSKECEDGDTSVSKASVAVAGKASPVEPIWVRVDEHGTEQQQEGKEQQQQQQRSYPWRDKNRGRLPSKPREVIPIVPYEECFQGF